VTNFEVALLSGNPAAFADVTAALATGLGFPDRAGAKAGGRDAEAFDPPRPRPAPRLQGLDGVLTSSRLLSNLLVALDAVERVAAHDVDEAQLATRIGHRPRPEG